MNTRRQTHVKQTKTQNKNEGGVFSVMPVCYANVRVCLI